MCRKLVAIAQVAQVGSRETLYRKLLFLQQLPYPKPYLLYTSRFLACARAIRSFASPWGIRTQMARS